jgi:glutamine amidotransferase
MRNHEINQDGWGFGWYSHKESGEVVLHRHRSSNGATDQYQHMDPELEQLVYKHPPISSRVIFSHLRASTDGGDGAPSAKDSHPFIFGRLLWMHNGGVHDKVALMEECGGPNLRQLVSGNTDTEYAGALFASYLRPPDKSKDNVTDHDVCHPRNGYTLDELTRAMKHTVARLRENDDKTGDGSSGGGSSLNLAVTDGIHVIAIRYRTRMDEEPPSLYYSFNVSSPSLWIASEPLEKETEENNQQWMLMAKDSMITFSTLTGESSQVCLTQACEEELFHRRQQENDT